MDLRKLKTLIDLVSESNISELEITEAEGKVRIVKASGAPAYYAPPPPAYYPQPAPQGYYGNQGYNPGYAGPPVCVLRERVWDPYAGQYVRVERRIPC